MEATKHSKNQARSASLHSESIAADCACAGINVAVLLWVHIEDTCCKPQRRWGARPRYSVGAQRLVMFLSWMGLAVAASPIALWYFFRFGQPYLGVSDDLVCQMQYNNTYLPVLALFLTCFNSILVSAVCFRRRGARRAVRSVPLHGSESVVVMPARRGLIAAMLAQRLDDGFLHCVDTWGTVATPASDEWCTENLVREGVPPGRARTVPCVVPARLPFASGSIDVVALPFLTMAGRPHLAATLRECLRILRPGGFVWGLEAVWRAKYVADVAASVGFEHPHKTGDGLHYVAAIPQRAFVARKPVLSGLVATEADKRSAARVVTGLHTSGAGLAGAATSVELRNSADDDHWGQPEEIGVAVRGSERTRLLARRSASTLAAKLRTSSTFAVFSRDSLLHCVAQLALLAVFVVYMGATVIYWDHLDVPTFVPWGTRIRTQLVQNARVYPTAFYYCYLETNAFIMAKQRTVCDIVVVILRVLLNTVLGLTVFSAVTWLPSFVLDTALHFWAHMSDDDVHIANLVVNVLFLLLVIRLIVYCAGRRDYDPT